MSGNDRHPDIKEFIEKAMSLEDVTLQSLFDVIKTELARREAIKNGLDVGERLQFDTTIDFIRQRTGLSAADALTMIRAHEPGRVRG